MDAECVGERAAICEIDHGYPRRQACIMALRQYLQYCGRYDDRVKAIVDSGGILDMARRALDEVKIYRTIGHDMSLLHYVKPE